MARLLAGASCLARAASSRAFAAELGAGYCRPLAAAESKHPAGSCCTSLASLQRAACTQHPWLAFSHARSPQQPLLSSLAGGHCSPAWREAAAKAALPACSHRPPPCGRCALCRGRQRRWSLVRAAAGAAYQAASSAQCCCQTSVTRPAALPSATTHPPSLFASPDCRSGHRPTTGVCYALPLP